MLVRRDGALRLLPCPLVDDDPEFDTPPDLEAACRTPTFTRHARCSLCRSVGVNYIGTDSLAGV